MSIKSELDKLKTEDIYSMLMFTLYQCRKTNEYSAISELSYILDEKNLLNLCEYFGGLTITVPTIEELELLLSGLTAYKSIVIDRCLVEEYFDSLNQHKDRVEKIKDVYLKIVDVMKDFSFGECDV